MQEKILDIQKVVADFYGVPLEQLRSRSNSKSIAHARQVAMYLIRERLYRSFPQVAESFERDHTTARHAHQVIADQLRAAKLVSMIERCLDQKDAAPATREA